MTRANLGGAFLVLGVVVLVLSILADALGLGRNDGFGWKQMLGVAIGIVLIGLGYYLRLRSR